MVKLLLYDNRLTGPIPRCVGNLSQLQWLDLQRNDLTGPIPVELCALSQLTRLYLGENRLTGPIPRCVGNLFQLQQLWLGTNDLTGPIPVELCALHQLELLYLDDLPYIAWTMPPCFATNLTSLTALVAPASGLTGALPPAWHLPKLEQLILLSLIHI